MRETSLIEKLRVTITHIQVQHDLALVQKFQIQLMLPNKNQIISKIFLLPKEYK